MGDKEATMIAEQLRNNTTVKALLFKSQNMEDKGGIAFAEMLKVNTTLQTLLLRSPAYDYATIIPVKADLFFL